MKLILPNKKGKQPVFLFNISSILFGVLYFNFNNFFIFAE